MAEVEEAIRTCVWDVAELGRLDYRPDFLKQAGETPERAERATNRLQKFKFSLLPDEKVEYNRAPAVRIISELEKILV